MMKHLDLFSGIGGFSLGLQRTGGFETVAFCDFDKKTHAVLNKNFPGVPIFDDVRTLKGEDVGTIDIITGGFPCQDLSVAGKGAGLAGERSGLWYEMHRLIKETQPRWVIAENVAVLRSRGLEEVLRSLAEIGYDAEWHCIPASAVGAPHRRDRIWIVAYPSSLRSFSKHQRDIVCVGEESRKKEGTGNQFTVCSSSRSPEMAYTGCKGLEGQRLRTSSAEQEQSLPTSIGCVVRVITRSNQWNIEPNVGRVANGVSGRVDRLKQLGNALVPQIVTIIGSAILEEENDHTIRHT
jgi:DNA (cytosine-5)-methyltransferase 1